MDGEENFYFKVVKPSAGFYPISSKHHTFSYLFTPFALADTLKDQLKVLRFNNFGITNILPTVSCRSPK